MPQLVIATLEGEALLQVDLTGREKLTLGRSPKCDVRLKGCDISRHHAVLFEENGRWTMIDLSADNSTLVEGERRRIIELSEDEPVQLDRIFLWFYDLERGFPTPPVLGADKAPLIALRSEYVEALWRAEQIVPAEQIEGAVA